MIDTIKNGQNTKKEEEEEGKSLAYSFSNKIPPQKQRSIFVWNNSNANNVIKKHNMSYI